MTNRSDYNLFRAFAAALHGQKVMYACCTFEQAQWARKQVAKWARGLPVVCKNGIPENLLIDYGTRLRGHKAEACYVDEGLPSRDATVAAMHILKTME